MRRLMVLTIVGALAIAGCGGSATKTASPRHADANASSSTSTTTPFVANTEHVPGTLTKLVGAHEDVHDTRCAQHDGRWLADGTVTNPTRRAVQYRIYVSFLRGETTVGLAETDVRKVAPKGSADWTASVHAATPGLRCILRVERAAA